MRGRTYEVITLSVQLVNHTYKQRGKVIFVGQMKKKTTKPNKSVSKELTQHFIQTVDKCFFPPSTDFGLEL